LKKYFLENCFIQPCDDTTESFVHSDGKPYVSFSFNTRVRCTPTVYAGHESTIVYLMTIDLTQREVYNTVKMSEMLKQDVIIGIQKNCSEMLRLHVTQKLAKLQKPIPDYVPKFTISFIEPQNVIEK